MSESKTPGGLGHVVQIYVLKPGSQLCRGVAATAISEEVSESVVSIRTGSSAFGTGLSDARLILSTTGIDLPKQRASDENDCLS